MKKFFSYVFNLMNIHNYKILEIMKFKHLLLGIALAGCCGLFLTSCEDEMDKGGTGGGTGMQDANTITRSTLPQEENEITLVLDTILTIDEDPDKQ